MAGTNTEKPMSKAEKKKTTAPVSKESKMVAEKTPVKKEKVVEEKKEAVKTQEKIKRTEAKAFARSMRSSTKVATAICKFIKRKTIKQAIEDLESVTKLKKAVPMKGEIAHRKGKMMSGKYPERAAKEFLVIVKNLQNNANQNDMENPIISEAVANKAMRPFARGGRARKKRTHVTLVAKEKKIIKQEKNKK